MSRRRDDERSNQSKETHGVNKKERGRRRLLAALGIGGGYTALIPTGWREPVVKSIVLPAHAQTSIVGSLDDPCNSVALAFQIQGFGVGGCTGGQFSTITPTVTGSVTAMGGADPGGIPINVQSIFSANGNEVPDDVREGSGVTNAAGNYSITLSGDPHGVCVINCTDSYPTGGLVTVTVTSPVLTGQSMCSAPFSCDDLPPPIGTGAENRSRDSESFYVELTPVDPSSRNKA
jgi:hypothetical protein